MAGESGVFLVLLLGILGTFGLYYFVRAEHNRRETMDREDAERVARRDKNDNG